MSQALRHANLGKLYLRLATRWLALLAGIFCAWQNFATDAQAKIIHVEFADGKAAIDTAVAKLKIPRSYSEPYYNLRGHIDLVRTRLGSRELAV